METIGHQTEFSAELMECSLDSLPSYKPEDLFLIDIVTPSVMKSFYKNITQY